jgi:hypothetical protein
LSLFSDNVPTVEKATIVERMVREAGEQKVRGNSAILLKGSPLLGDFASNRTSRILSHFPIDNSFLMLICHLIYGVPVNTTCQGQERLKKLRVVNDTAERGVKLFEEYNTLLTNDETEKQLVLQIVEANRKAVPTQTTKKSAIEALLKQ